jgi:lysophospholipase L1-like esterase
MAWINTVCKRGAVAGLSGLSGLVLTGAALLAEATSPPLPGALSAECQTPGVTVVTERPLPAALAALRDRKVLKILAIGASASAGMSAASGGYQEQIKEILEKRVPGLDVQIIDRGISGELARDAASRLRTEVALTEPDLVLWQVGSNDAMAQIPVEAFAETVTEAIQWLKERNVDVVLVGLQYVRAMRYDPHYQAIRDAIARIADTEKILRIGRYEAMEVMERMRETSSAERPSEFALTEAGYACMAEYVVRAITSGVFLKRPVNNARP